MTRRTSHLAQHNATIITFGLVGLLRSLDAVAEILSAAGVRALRYNEYYK